MPLLRTSGLIFPWVQRVEQTSGAKRLTNPQVLYSGDALIVRWGHKQGDQTITQRVGRSQILYSGDTLIVRWAAYNALTGRAQFQSDGSTTCTFTPPITGFESDGSTSVIWIVTPNTTSFESDGTTTVSFVGAGGTQFVGAGSTTVEFTGSTGGSFRIDGSTEVTFFVRDGQLASCIVGDGVVPGDTPGGGAINAVH